LEALLQHFFLCIPWLRRETHCCNTQDERSSGKLSGFPLPQCTENNF
jgi:hypothetical protein